MIRYFSDKPHSQSYPLPLLNLFYPSAGNFIAIVGPMSLSPATLDLKAAFLRSTDLPVFSINAPSQIAGIDFSDHRNYWNAGYDAVMVTDTSFFRNRAYHTAADTADRLDYKKMSDVVSGVYAYLLDISSNKN
jgi:Zn-dependent M28 family amino/carboxypeptidase